MKIMIVFDSVFGNTKKLASFMADEIGASLLHVSEAGYGHIDADLLLICSPTRAFRPTPAVYAWLKKLPADKLDGVRAAAFDTRLNVENVHSALLKKLSKRMGYAAEHISKLLIKKGALIVADPEGFFVSDSEGPLADGELSRGAEWVRALVKP